MSFAGLGVAAEDGPTDVPPPPPAFGRSQQIRAGLMAVGALGLALVTQVVLKQPNSSVRGMPMAILFQGLISGLVIALTAVGMVLIYRTIRIINFVAAASGVGGAIFFTWMTGFRHGFPFPLTVLGALAIGVLTGMVVDLSFGRRFAKAPRLVLTVVTIAGSPALITYAAQGVTRLPWFPKGEDINTAELAADRLRARMPFPGLSFQVGKFPLKFGFPELFAIEMAIVLLIVVGVFVRYTRVGTAIRASAENAERAALLGIGTGMLGTIVWGLVGGLSAGTSILAGMVNLGGASSSSFALLFPPLAACVLAKFRSLPMAIYASVLIGILQVSLEFSLGTKAATYSAAILLAIVVGGLLVQRKDLFRLESAGNSSWQAAEEPRPVPKELRAVSGVRAARLALLVAAGALVVGFPFFASVRYQSLASVILINTIAGVSLVVLTGWAGQVSLGQYAFVGVGALITGAVMKAGLGFWLAVPVAIVGTGLVALAVGLPALRIKGLFLAAVTFGFAVFVGALLASPDFGLEWLPTNLTRPTLVFLDFDEERSMYFLSLVGLILVILVTVNLRKSRLGRLLIAVRDNEANVQSFGIRVVRTKLTAFMISGAMCGFAGALLEIQARGADGRNFGAEQSFQTFVVTVLGGVASPAGALLGSAYINSLTFFFSQNLFIQLLGPTLPLVLIFAAPGGVLSLVLKVRDAVLRIVAQRRQIVVPSLFADYDAEALERRLVPLSEASMTDGLAALPPGQRYTMPSDLYRGHGERILEKLAGPKQSKELAAFSAAADAGEAPSLASGPPIPAPTAGASA